MTNRKLADIIKDQEPLMMPEDETVQHACKLMWDRRAGSVLVVDNNQRLLGIFTGRDAVRALAQQGQNAARARLSGAMKPTPTTVTPDHRAIDALRAMCDGGFRHVPVVEVDGRIWGVVSRGDFLGIEIDRLDEEEHLAQIIR
jgi:CBS domain-containing protein